MAEKRVLVIGGGISGLTAAVEAAEAGMEAVIVEKNAYLGGRVAQLYRYFPKLCPPYCGLEINFRRIKTNPRIKFYTQAEVESISGSEGNFEATIRVSPRFVNEKCTACGDCEAACDVERPNEFNFGMDSTKAAYLPHEQAFPMRYVIDGDACKGSGCNKCVEACKYDAIDLSMEAETVKVTASSIVYATGWNPYDASKIDNLNFGVAKNVITNVMMERLAAPNGPTGGKILRPSDGKEVKNVAFAQCAGSRDQNNLDYCSAICCMASLKQATYIREQYPEDGEATIYYIDLRTPGKYEDFLKKLEEDEKVNLVKGKIAKIEEDAATGDVIITAEDVLGGGKIEERYDMVVLAAGMEPSVVQGGLAGDIGKEDNGFLLNASKPGMYAAGVAQAPGDVAQSVQSGTSSALRSLQSARGGE